MPTNLRSISLALLVLLAAPPAQAQQRRSPAIAHAVDDERPPVRESLFAPVDHTLRDVGAALMTLGGIAIVAGGAFMLAGVDLPDWNIAPDLGGSSSRSSRSSWDGDRGLVLAGAITAPIGAVSLLVGAIVFSQRTTERGSPSVMFLPDTDGARLSISGTF